MLGLLPSLRQHAQDRMLAATSVLGGCLAVMYAPVFESLARTVWNTDEQGHGPIIVALVMWLMWQRRDRLRIAAETSQPAGMSGWLTIFCGLAIYVAGRMLGILFFEVGSLIPLLAGALAVTFGWRVTRAAAFPIFFLVFCVPLPGPLVDALTQPLKHGVSWVADQALHAMGYPISRTGVVLIIGQYQLLVADACAGLNTMFTLEALGVLYMNIMGYTSRLRNVLLAILIIPMSFCANVIRVMMLALVTYHFGDEVGRGIAHGAAGMLLFAVALVLMFAIDAGLGVLFRDTDKRTV